MDLSAPLVPPLGPVVISTGALLVALLVALLLLLLRYAGRRIVDGYLIQLRPLAGVQLLERQIGQAIESGEQIHLGLGRGELIGRQSMTSLSGLAVLDALAEDSCANDTPPLVTANAGTLHPAAQDSLFRGYVAAGRLRDYRADSALLLAPDSAPFVYAAGVADLITNHGVCSNILVGHFGSEIVLLTEAADRQATTQIIGSDDPTALAIASTVTPHLLIGEELLATRSYLERRDSRIAALRAQDFMRYAVAAALLLAALYGLITGG
jgi:hypothetical protein